MRQRLRAQRVCWSSCNPLRGIIYRSYAEIYEKNKTAILPYLAEYYDICAHCLDSILVAARASPGVAFAAAGQYMGLDCRLPSGGVGVFSGG